MLEGAIVSTSWNPSDNFLSRLRRSYGLALEGHKSETSVLWGAIIPPKQRAVHDALLSGDNLRDLLTHPGETNLYFGVDNLCLDIRSAMPQSQPMALHIASELQKLR